MAKHEYDEAQLHELLYQALETEIGGIDVYQTALSCAVNEDLRKEWEEYLEQTRTHREVLLNVFSDLGLDPARQTPGRKVVAHMGKSLVQAMEMAKAAGDPTAAELVAGECVVLAETKDHMNWELIGLVAEKGKGEATRVLKAAYEAVEQDEDHHLYHTTGFTRELWIDSLGLPAVLPPPEERKNVETAIGASRAEHKRDEMLRSGKTH
jgi:ferritin-like metal-binding protein YciE